MSVELQIWVVPKQRGFRPSLEQVAALANSLQQQKWVPSADAPGQRQRVLELLPGEEGPISKKPMREHARGDKPFTAAWLECLAEHEVLLEWNVDDSAEAGVQYPFTFDP